MRFERFSLILVSLAVAAWLHPSFAAVSRSTGIDWHLYDATCVGGAAAVDVACGSYGRFLILQSQAPPGCVPKASGSEDPAIYPLSPVARAFPTRQARLKEIAPHEAPMNLTDPPLQPVSRWIAVLDFDSPHGESTAWLAGQVAGPDVTAALAPLDDPALNPVGDVGDFHVLARLCEVAQDVDAGSLPPPLTVNMSFGRRARASDPTSGTVCPAQNVACQVAKVAHHVSASGSWLIAASGNHGEALFPGSLDDVVDTGMVDLNMYLAGIATHPAWETPPATAAWIPGNDLCLDGWSAPPGSSYSSALLSGWLVQLIDHPEVFDTLGDGPWVPQWSESLGCFELAKARKGTPFCNDAITSIFDALLGPDPPGCGHRATDPTVVTPPPGQAMTPDPIPSIDTWGAPTHPAPESDPCVPCSGSLVASNTGLDLRLDLSESDPLPSGVVLDQVALRVATNYYVLGLTPSQLQLMDDGGLATLVVPNGGALIPQGTSVSLWYRMKPNASVNCANSSQCFWSSTPLLIEASK